MNPQIFQNSSGDEIVRHSNARSQGDYSQAEPKTYGLDVKKSTHKSLQLISASVTIGNSRKRRGEEVDMVNC